MRKKYVKLGKRITAAALALTMMVGVSGCGSSKDEKSDVTQQATNIDMEYNGMEYDDMGYDQIENNGVQYDMAAESPLYPSDNSALYSDIDVEGYDDFNTNEYSNVTENSWLSVKASPLSTFAADVDTASYTNIRSNIEYGYEVPASSVRIEEMINYFHYDYEDPAKGEKFAVYTEYADCPWNEDSKLALISLNTEAIDFAEAPDSNIVFLIDVSGSMFDSNKLPLIQQSLCLLVENLTKKDRVSIVTYAGDDAVVLEGVTGDNYFEISQAIERLEAGGSTNGSAGINTAYEIAEKYFIEGGNNRVILATDGDLNVGVTSEGELERLITKKKKSGVFLSVLGVGYGNYKDNKLETLADKGNGNYAYIDSIYEAKKALVDDMGATMVTVAKDVKLQVEFNPNMVKGYRLIGYENRVMAAEDFDDDTKDGGEMGAGHSVTAIYEIALIDSDIEINEPDLKYESEDNKTMDEIKDSTADSNELFNVDVRYKEPDSDVSELKSYVCMADDYNKKGSDNLRWAAAVAGFGMLMMDSEYMGKTDKKLILTIAKSVSDYKEDEYKAEFIGLVEKYNATPSDDYGDIFNE